MIIALLGNIGSGKDTVAEYLVQHHNFARCSFASSLKDATAAIFGWDRDLLEGKTNHSREWRETIDPWWAEKLGVPHLTPRWVLQHLGTNILRHHFHSDIWVLSAQRHLESHSGNIVISDARFTNEIAAIRSSGGRIVQVRRGGEPRWWSTAQAAVNGDQNAIDKLADMKIHESEWAWSTAKPDLIIQNDGTLDDLYNQADSLTA